MEHADAAVASRFHLLGLRNLDFGRPVNWHFDPTRGMTAPDRHWSRVPYLDERVVGDHKVIWELNRHQWLVTVAQAWRLTGDHRYLDRIAAALEEWLDANPPRRGINWASSLELAFRAVAWSWVLHLTAGALPDIRRLHARLLDSLVVHGSQIEHHLSTWFSPNTHLTGEALGLLYLGTGWPSLPQARRWRESGWRILSEQLPIQVRPDGTYFEQAAWYQGYTTDFYLHGLLLARAADLPVPPSALDLIGRAVAVVAELARPDGSLPRIGDDDGGRLLPLAPDRGDFRDTVALGAAVSGRPESCLPGVVPASPAWLLGLRAWQGLTSRIATEAPQRSRAFPDGGWYLLRGADGMLLVDVGPHGSLAGGHSHADALAVDLTVGNRPVIVDPGTGAYVGPWRDAFRATSAHSTLCLADGSGSATPAGQFRWGRWPEVTVRHWSAADGWAALEAEHDGFSGSVPGLIHRRTVIFHQGWGWLVLDQVLGAEAESQLRFQLDPGLDVALDQGVVTARTEDGATILQVVPDRDTGVSLGSGLVSRAYGAAQPAPVVIRRLTAGQGQHGAVTLLASGPGEAVRPDATGQAWLWTGGHPPARLAIGRDGVTTIESDELSLTLD